MSEIIDTAKAEPMSHEERNTVASLITSLAVLIYFGARIWGTWAEGGYAGPDGPQIWARNVLWMIPICVGVTIVVTIGFNILHAIFTNTPKPSFVTDERDTHIGRRGMLVTMIVVSFGFIGSLILLALGWQVLVVLNAILAAFVLGDIAGSLSKLAAYRLGL